MKYLQINKIDGELNPKLLEMGVDFDMIFENYLLKSTSDYGGEIKDGKSGDYALIEHDTDIVALISDCYQSRPLIEINGFCEFDIIFYPDEDGFVYPKPLLVILHKKELKYGSFFEDGFFDYTSFSDFKYKKAGSIFTEENTVKYSKLYEEAIKIINQSK
jgi:hypothetical protein